MTSHYLYDLDVTGNLAANKIEDEPHTIQIPSGDMSAFIVPEAAPFYKSSMVVMHGSGQGAEQLTEGVDFLFTHEFVEATKKIGLPIYGSISFINRNLSGQVYLTYQTLGGGFTVNDISIIRELTEKLYELRTVTWDQVLGVPVKLPSIEHQQPLEDLKGFGDFITAFEELRDAIQNKDMQWPSPPDTYTSAGTLKDPYMLTTQSNLNNLTARGFYVCENTSAADTSRNFPKQAVTGLMSVTKDGNRIIQEYQEITDPNRETPLDIVGAMESHDGFLNWRGFKTNFARKQWQRISEDGGNTWSPWIDYHELERYWDRPIARLRTSFDFKSLNKIKHLTKSFPAANQSGQEYNLADIGYFGFIASRYRSDIGDVRSGKTLVECDFYYVEPSAAVPHFIVHHPPTVGNFVCVDRFASDIQSFSGNPQYGSDINGYIDGLVSSAGYGVITGNTDRYEFRVWALKEDSNTAGWSNGVVNDTSGDSVGKAWLPRQARMTYGISAGGTSLDGALFGSGINSIYLTYHVDGEEFVVNLENSVFPDIIKQDGDNGIGSPNAMFIAQDTHPNVTHHETAFRMPDDADSRFGFDPNHMVNDQNPEYNRNIAYHMVRKWYSGGYFPINLQHPDDDGSYSYSFDMNMIFWALS